MLKKLLLLGLLRGQKLHGYGVVEYLNEHASGGAAIGKSNAYRLLRVLEEDGLIRSNIERDGNRPERHVYTVTPAGEAWFRQYLLRELALDATADQPGIAVLNYLNEVDPAEAAAQLELRRDSVAARHHQLLHVPQEVLHLHPALDFSRQQVALELNWLNSKIAELRERATGAVRRTGTA